MWKKVIWNRYGISFTIAFMTSMISLGFGLQMMNSPPSSTVYEPGTIQTAGIILASAGGLGMLIFIICLIGNYIHTVLMSDDHDGASEATMMNLASAFDDAPQNDNPPEVDEELT